MWLFRIAGILCASALMLASPTAIAAPVFDNDTEFIVSAPNESNLDLATNQNISIAEAPVFCVAAFTRSPVAAFTRSPVGVAASQNTQAPATMIVEHAAALPPFDPG